MLLNSIKFSIKFVPKTKNNMHEKRLAEKFTLDDRIEVDLILGSIRKDARGREQYNQNQVRGLLVYFRKHIDPNVKDNIFGCGGCAKKVIQQMRNISKEWQNPII